MKNILLSLLISLAMLAGNAHAINIHDAPVSHLNPLPAQLTDHAGRQSLGSLFGDSVIGTRVSDIQCQFTSSLADQMVTDGSTGTGSTTHASGSALIHSGTGVGLGRLTSVDSITYRAGHDVVAYFTAAFTAGEANSNQHIGPHDDENGFWVGYEDDVFGIGLITGSATTFTPATSFTLDKLTGLDHSQIELDFSTLNIYRITYGYLGIAPAIFEVYGGFDLGWLPFHVIDLTNSQTTPIILNPNLPIRVDAERTSGTGADLIIRTASWHGSTIGETSWTAGNRHFTAENTQAVSSTAVYTPILSVKNKTTYPTAVPLTNHIPAIVEFLSMATDGTKNVELVLIEGGVLTGASFADVDAINSIMQVDTAATAITGGAEIIPLILAKNDSQVFHLDRGDVKIRPNGTVTLAARMISVGSSEVTGAIHWNEAF